VILDDPSRVTRFDVGERWQMCATCGNALVTSSTAEPERCPSCGTVFALTTVGTVSRVDIAAGSYMVESGDDKALANDGPRNRAERRADRRRK
jgi:hypothetical protein